jgi:predicted TIM-barrel fold metal-dependent hydrolase
MRIDAHAHLVPKAREAFSEEFHKARLDYAVVMILPSALEIDSEAEYQLPINAETLESLKQDNLRLAQVCAQNPRYLQFAWLDHRMEDAVGFLDTLVKEHGFRGLKIHQVFNGEAGKE